MSDEDKKLKENVEKIMQEQKEFIDNIKAQLVSPSAVVDDLENNKLLEKTDDEKGEMLKHFFLLYWELFLASQNLARCGDVSALAVFMMLRLFSDISNDKATNNDIIKFVNQLLQLHSDNIEEGDTDGQG